MKYPANHYEGQTVHYNGHRYTIIEGPEFEYAPIAEAINEKGQDTLLFLKIDDNGAIVRAATRQGRWENVTVEQRSK